MSVVDSIRQTSPPVELTVGDAASLQTNHNGTVNAAEKSETTADLPSETSRVIGLMMEPELSAGSQASLTETAILHRINEPAVQLADKPVVQETSVAPLAISEGLGKSVVRENVSVLGAEGLRKSYRKRTVVNNISLAIKQNEIVGLLGPNGAGKTTVFYMIVGLEKPDKGKIYLDSKDISRLPMYLRARNGISYLPQEASVFRKLTVEENILLVLQTMPLSKREREHRLESLLDELDIEYVRHTKAYQLSGGERRRTEIARCLVIEPRFILLDEPFAGIDPIAVIDIQRILQKLRASGIGVLITDHNVRETLAITDRAYIINEGQIFRAGTPDALTQDEEVKRVYLGENFRM